MRLIIIMLMAGISIAIVSCKFDFIHQPATANPGEIISIEISVSDNLVPEPNAHKGLLCILIPEDWTFISASYDGTIGSGTLSLSDSWADSAEACYPASEFEEGMRWIALISDQGYAYEDPIQIDVDVTLQVGETEGCFNLAYLVTKATPDLLCTSYTPLSYPHPIGIPDSCGLQEELKAEPAPEWDALFDRQEGWTGADGIYSIPLDGVEIPENPDPENTLLLFSDTFIGTVDDEDNRINSKLINNTYAILEGTQPVEENIGFFWDSTATEPAAVFIPDTPQSKEGDWYWLMDGIVIGDSVYVYALRLDNSVEPFALLGVSLISFSKDLSNGIGSYHQTDTPLFYEPGDNSGQIVMGQAIMPMTEISGAPSPDGYIYIYGPKSSPGNKDLLAGRFRPEDVRNFDNYEFWNGSEWGNDMTECESLTSSISQEFSITPLVDDRFLLVFQLSTSVAVRFGESPTGPFDFYQFIYDCPEVEIDPDVFVYNAKAHPHLSQTSSMLISYNVNTYDFWDHFSNADIYRPRFIELPLEQGSSFSDEKNGKRSTPISGFKLFPNFPNPFNPSTNIRFEISQPGRVTLAVYDVSGHVIAEIRDDWYPTGTFEAGWDGLNQTGAAVSSGIYYLRMQMGDRQQVQRMMLIR